jgi:hypothetical protein
MILCNGRAIFHEKRAKRSRHRDSNLRRRKCRATGDSGGAGPIPGSRGKPRFARVGRSSGSAGQPEFQELRIGEPDATGNRGGHGTERCAKGDGQPKSTASRTGDARAAGNRGPRKTGNEPRQQRATGVAVGSTNLRWYRETGVTKRAETNFRKRRATGTSTEPRATGVPRNLRATGDFNRRRIGSHRGTVAERARGAGAQALRSRATATSGSWARVAEASSSKNSDRRGRDPARDFAPFAFPRTPFPSGISRLTRRPPEQCSRDQLSSVKVVSPLPDEVDLESRGKTRHAGFADEKPENDCNATRPRRDTWLDCRHRRRENAGFQRPWFRFWFPSPHAARPAPSHRRLPFTMAGTISILRLGPGKRGCAWCAIP